MSSIYFISNGGAIKIGRSAAVGRRFRELETGSSNPLAILACIDGGPGHERAIHAELAAYRIRGEWFVDCSAVRNAIDRYKTEGAPLFEINLEQKPNTFSSVDPKSVAAALVSLSEDPDRLRRLDAELDALKLQRQRLEQERAIQAQPAGPFIGVDP